MKQLTLIIINIFLVNLLTAQVGGKITYKETIKLDIQFEGMDENMKAMLPESQSITKELLFKDGISVYQNKKGEAMEDLEMESDDGSFKIKIATDDTEDILYQNTKTKEKVHQRGMMGKSFVVSDKLPKHKWKITAEKIKYLGYECQKAVIEEEDRFVVAWFTSQIPAQVGPGSYHGLPGAILLVSVNEGEREIKALSVDLSTVDEKMLIAPKKGKKVSEEEFTRIQEEKQKEMEEMSGGRHIRIRN